MPEDLQMRRMKQILMLSSQKPMLLALKKRVRNWKTPGAPNQDGVNRAIVRALDEIQNRLDSLMRL